MTTGHTLLYAEDGVISDRHVAYYAERAKGGVGLMVIEQQAAHPSGRNYLAGCRAYDPVVVPRYARLAAACHAHGARVFAQLFCGGAQGQGTQYIDAWRHLLAPSAIASTQFQELPAAMEPDDIASVVEGFAISARHVRDGGLDGIEIHAAHSQLLGSFLSPAFNRRSDGYGGNLANRCRIVAEVGDAIRKRIGGTLALGLRLSVDEHLPQQSGITPEQLYAQLDYFLGTGLFDFFDLSVGGYYTQHVSVAPMGSNLESGFLAPYGKRAKGIVGDRARIFLVGRIVDLQRAEEIVRDGASDMVAMTRAHMADPFIVTKALASRTDDQVRCIGANVCIRRLHEGNHVICVMNPALGRESRWGEGTLKPTSSPRRIALVGGGPSGMRFAATAARRGHRIVLFEAARELGGRLRRLRLLPGQEKWSLGIENLAVPLRRLSVDIHLETRADGEAIARERPDIVVCATGSSYDKIGFSTLRLDRPGIPGTEQPHVIDIGTAIDRASASPAALGKRVVIFDEAGEYQAGGLALLLGRAGVAVTLVTPRQSYGERLANTRELPILMPHLRSAGVDIRPQRHIDRITESSAVLYDMWDKAALESIDGADTVVLAITRRSDDALFHSIRDRFPSVHRLGDALAPRSIEAVIYDGERLGREV